MTESNGMSAELMREADELTRICISKYLGEDLHYHDSLKGVGYNFYAQEGAIHISGNIDRVVRWGPEFAIHDGPLSFGWVEGDPTCSLLDPKGNLITGVLLLSFRTSRKI